MTEGPCFEIDRRHLVKTGLAGIGLGTVVGAGIGSAGTANATAGTAEWPSFQFDPGNTGRDPSATAPDPDASLTRTFEVPHDPVGSPVVGDGVLYVSASDRYSDASGNSKLRAFDLSDGSQRWSRDLTGHFSVSSVVVYDGRVYANDQGIGHVFAFDATTGDQQWAREIGYGPVACDPANDVVFCSRYGLDPATGDTRWKAPRGAVEQGAPAVANGTMYYSDVDGGLSAVSTADGSEVWRSTKPRSGSPTATGDAVYVPVDYQRIRAHHPDDGSVLWTSPDLREYGDLVGLIAAADDAIYAADGTVVAVDPADGSIMWRADPDDTWGYPVVVSDVLCVSSLSNNQVVFLDRTDGTELGRADVPKVNDTLAVANGAVYTGDDDVYEVAPGGGNEPPEARFTVTPEKPTVGETVTLDARMSSDSDGRIERYDWDTDDDGSYEYAGDTLVGQFQNAGEFTVTLRVTDDDGATDFASKHVTVTAGEDARLSVEGDTVEAGESATFDVSVTNTGATTLGDDETPFVTVRYQGGTDTDAYPPDWEFSDWNTSEGGFDYDTWGGFSLDPDETAEASVTVATPSEADGDYEFTWALATQSNPDTPIATEEATISVEQPFTPNIHGFGFDNYGGGELPEFEEVYDIVSTTYVSDLQDIGINTYPPGFVPALAGVVYTAMDGGLMNGHCLGMTNVAREYYNEGVPALPEYDRTVDTAADIVIPNGEETPETVPSLEPVERDIDEIQNAQALDPKFALRYIAEVFAPESGPGSIDHVSVVDAVETKLENDELVSMSLVDTSGGVIDSFVNGHQVLAYGSIDEWERGRGDSKTEYVSIPIYNPNKKAALYTDGFMEDLVFRRPAGSDEDYSLAYAGVDEDSGTTYDRAIVLDDDPDYDLEFFNDGEKLDGFRAALSQGLSDFISVGVLSPVTLDISAPDGTSVPRVGVPTDQLRAATGYEALYVLPEAPAGDYDIQATATGSGEYTVELMGTQTKGGTVNASYTGSVSAGETQSLTGTVPDTSGESGGIEPEDDDTGPVERFDTDGDGVISTPELQNAIQQWATGEIDTSTLQAVIEAWAVGG